MEDVDGDGVLDLIVGAGKDHASEVVAYTGAVRGGKGAFATELTRFAPFLSCQARGGVSVTEAAQIDGSAIDNIIVGSGVGIPSEVKVYSSCAAIGRCGAGGFLELQAVRRRRSGVSIATGFVDFATGRDSIVTAPGAGSATEVKVFAFPLLKAIDKAGERGTANGERPTSPLNTASFMPFGEGLPGRRFARDRLAGRLARRRQAHYRQPARGQAVQ